MPTWRLPGASHRHRGSAPQPRPPRRLPLRPPASAPRRAARLGVSPSGVRASPSPPPLRADRLRPSGSGLGPPLRSAPGRRADRLRALASPTAPSGRPRPPPLRGSAPPLPGCQVDASSPRRIRQSPLIWAGWCAGLKPPTTTGP